MKKTLLSVLLVMAILVTLPVLAVSATEETTAATEETVAPEVTPAHGDHCVCGGSAVGIHDHECADLVWEPWPEGATSFS